MAKNGINDYDDVDAENWKQLAEHLQIKVNRRTSEVAFLQTKAGFLIAASVIAIQSIISLEKSESPIELVILIGALLSGFGALIMSIVSMHISKTASPLKPDEMILRLTEDKTMSRRTFNNWLAKSYAKTNSEFNSTYSKKYNQQIAAAIMIVISFLALVALKGIAIYV